MGERRVTHLVPALFGPGGTVGGAERYVLELARHMAARLPTTLVTFGPDAGVSTLGPLTVRVVRPSRHIRGQTSNPFAWAAVADASRADVVHCHQQHVVATSATAIVARLRQRRVFCTDLGGGGWDLSAYVSTNRLFHGHLHISAYSKAIYGHDGLATARVIYGGVDATRFHPDAAAARDVDCLFVGRLLPHKGVDVLLEAAPSDLRLVIAGPAPDARYLADLHALAKGKDVTFVHDADDAALLGWYRRTTCVALPSLYVDRYGGQTRVPELLGQTLLEGMACGAATLCTAVASLPEIVVDGVTGRIVPPADLSAMRAALIWMRDNDVAARQMGAAGRARVLADFTWDTVVDRCLEAYSS